MAGASNMAKRVRYVKQMGYTNVVNVALVELFIRMPIGPEHVLQENSASLNHIILEVKTY